MDAVSLQPLMLVGCHHFVEQIEDICTWLGTMDHVCCFGLLRPLQDFLEKVGNACTFQINHKQHAIHFLFFWIRSH